MVFDGIIEKHKEKKEQEELDYWKRILLKNSFVKEIFNVITKDNVQSTIFNKQYSSGFLVTINSYGIDIMLDKKPNLISSKGITCHFSYADNGLNYLPGAGIVALGDLLFEAIRSKGPSTYYFRGTSSYYNWDDSYGVGKGGVGVTKFIGPIGRTLDDIEKYNITFEKITESW